jgi:hypothetical protein
LVFPAGIYTIDDTLTISPGSKIVGILWPQLMAVGKAFKDKNDPRVFIRVGEPDRKAPSKYRTFS